MIIVTGATGQLGRQIVEHLLTRLPAQRLGVSVRDPGKAQDLAERGVRVVRGDFADPATLAQAFEGAEQVLITSVNQLGEEAVRQHGQAIEAARVAGARRVLYTSHQAANPSSAFVPARDHAATEALLRASGVPFVALRNGFYAESALYQLEGLRSSDVLALPQDGPVSWTARADLAEAAAVILAAPERFEGVTPPLTAAAALTFDDVAQLAPEVLGKAVGRATVSDDEYVAARVAQGFPDAMAQMLLGLYVASRVGEFNVVDPTLEGLLGRPPTQFQTVWQDAHATLGLEQSGH